MCSNSNDSPSLHPVPCALSKTLDTVVITECQVQFLLCNLIEFKATGPDEIRTCILKRCSEVIAPFLTALFKISLESGVVPLIRNQQI